MSNSSRERRVSGQRLALWLALLSAIAVIGVLWFLRDGSEGPQGNKASRAAGSFDAANGGNDGQREQSPQKLESQSELEKAVTEKMAELFAKYRVRLTEYKRLEKGTRHLAATIRDAREVVTTSINNAGKLVNESWQPYFAQNASAISKLQFQCVRLLSVEMLLESLKSTAQTGDTNFGALMQDLLINTDYPELLETNLKQLAKDAGFTPPNLRQPDGNRTLPEMIEELQKLTPALEEQRKKILASGLPPEMHEFMTAQSRAFAVQDLVGSYDKSWNGKANEAQKRVLETSLQIRNQLSRLPATSNTRARLGSEYQALIIDINKTAQQP
jgi:hypothetical protein